MNAQPSRKLKLFFWLILGAYSTFFAEVVSGSDMFPFFHLWGILMVVPLYTLHTLILAHIVFNYGKPRLYTLFFAGAIFGLYEAYITKVLWSPPWTDEPLAIAGVAVSELIVLVLFWHPFLAFIVPLFAGETLLTRSRNILNGLPSRLQQLFDSEKKFYVLLALLALTMGAIQAAGSPSPGRSLLSGLSTTAVLLLLTYSWHRTKGKSYDIQALLPSRREFAVLLVMTLAMYVIFGISLRPEALPGLLPQSTICLNYVLLFALLILSLRKSKRMTLAEATLPPVPFSWKTLLMLALLFTFSSTLGNLVLAPFSDVFFLLAWLIWGGVGIVTFLLAVKDALDWTSQQGGERHE